MTTNRSLKTHPIVATLAVALVSAGAVGILADHALAQQQTEPGAANAATRTPAASALLSIADIERKVSAEGLQVTDIELRERIAEVEGKDSAGREVEWIVDRRDGRILARDLDD